MAELSIDVEGKLCGVCILLDIPRAFEDDDYDVPITAANPFGSWRGQFCWHLKHIKSNEATCPLCRLVYHALQCNSAFEGISSGIAAARRTGLFSKEKDQSLPGYHVLSLGVMPDGILRSPTDYGVCIARLGRRKIKLENTLNACLKHFYPGLPPGMLPMSTTDEQAKMFDAWRAETGEVYEVTTREVNREQLDLNLIAGWLKTCEQAHTKWCGPKRRGFQVPNFRVIDVVKMNISIAPDHCRYLALSYVWGQVHGTGNYLRLLRENHLKMRRPGSLEDCINLLPSTIQDAILLCQKLGEKYLWVDSLCIIQDSPKDQADQISRMDIIYRDSVVTLVAAAGGDANAGLPRLRTTSPLGRSLTTRVRNTDLVVLTKSGEQVVDASKWNTRAWTFQERLLSPRLLLFTAHSVTFECLEACWREDFDVKGKDAEMLRLVEDERRTQQTRENFHQIMSDQKSDFAKMIPAEKTGVSESIYRGAYAPLVADYTKRHLTNENDILNAFGGIQSVLSRLMGEFSHGLPQHLLAQSLAWISSNGDMFSRSNFPTFAWVGWVFGDGNNASCLVQIHGPYPSFSFYSDDQPNQPRWSSDVSNDPYRGIWGWHDGLLYPSDDIIAQEVDIVVRKTIERMAQTQSPISLSSVLFFWTTTAPFRSICDKDEMDLLVKGAKIIRMYEKSFLFGNDLNEEESQLMVRKPVPSSIELAYLGVASNGNFALMLIRWTCGIARRILPQLLITINAEDWEDIKPQRKLIVLG